MKFFRTLPRRHVHNALVAVVLAVIAALTWSWFYYRLDPVNWNKPVAIGGDAMLIMGGAQAAAEGDFTPWLFKEPHRLGAPFVSEWNSWPITEEFLFWTIGVVSRLVGMPAAVSLVMMAGHALAAAAFYWACRLLGKRRLPSAVFALLFGLSSYLFRRGLGHLTVGYCWHVPLCWAVVCFAFSARGIFKNRRRTVLAFAVAVITGLQNPYHTFIFVQFLGIAFVVQALRRRSWGVILGPAAVAAAALAVFVSMQADTLLDHVVNHRGSLSAQRSYMDMELYALKPLDLFLPLQYQLPFLEKQSLDYSTQKVVTGEYPMAFLGFVAAAGALLLAGMTFRDLTLRGGRLSAPVRQYAVPSAWIVALSMAGGLLAIGALITGAYFLRAADRFSVFIVLLVMFFLVDVFTSATRRLPLWAKVAVLALPLLLGAWEVRRFRPAEAYIARAGVDWENYGRFVRGIEKTAGRDAMIFNLPAVEFPEIVPLNQEDVYAPLMLYVTRPSALRFSYGNMRGDYRDTWQQTCAHLPPEQMVAELRRYGFGGVVVSCAAYPDRGRALLDSLTTVTGQPAVVTPEDDLAFVPFAPSPPPKVSGELPATANISMLGGWWPIEYFADGRALQWTRGDATLALYRDPALGAQVPAVISLTLATPTARTVHLSCRGKTILKMALQPNIDYSLESLRVPVKPGWNLLHLRTDQPAVRRPDVPLDTRDVALLVTAVRAGGLAQGGEGIPVGTPIPNEGGSKPDAHAALKDAAVLEASDADGRLWQELRGDAAATTSGSARQPVRRIEFLPNGHSFCVLAEITPGPAQVESATLLSSLTPDIHGFTFEREAGKDTTYNCALGNGTIYAPVGTSMEFLPGHHYLVALNLSGQSLTIRVRGDDGLNETFTCDGPDAASQNVAYWRWGNWLFEGRPFAGRIEMLSMGGALPAAGLEQLLDRHQSEAAPVAAPPATP